MSVTIGTLAGTTGLGSSRQVVTTASGDLWAFGFTGTVTLASWYSQDGGATWTAGATLALASAHLGEGRNLQVGYKSIGGVDVVYIGIVYKSSTSLGAREIRATIAGTTLTFHSSVTSVASPTADGDSLFWAGGDIGFTSDNKVHWSSSYAAGGNGDVNVSDSTADAGGAEQQTPVTWTPHVVDSSVLKENRSAGIVDLGATTAALIADDGSAASTTTGLDWHAWNGSAWNTDNTNQKVTGAISAIDKNDWGFVKVAFNDVHVVYRDSTGTLIHRRYNGSVWQAGQAIPAQTCLAGGGIGLQSDGANVWLTVIDTDAANTIRRIGWSSAATNGIQDAWDPGWQVVEGSSATRTFLGCARDVVNQVGLVYWTEGTSFTSATFAAVPPVDPAGAFVQSAQVASAVSSTTLGVAFTTQNVIGGNMIVVHAAIWHSPGTTITSVTDSAGNTYIEKAHGTESDGTYLTQWAALITAGSGTKPTVTLHASAATAEWGMQIQEWNGTKTTTDGIAQAVVTSAASPVTSGPASPTPAVTGEVAIGTYGDGGNNVATIGPSAGWTQRGTSIQGTSTTAELCCIDQFTTAGVAPNASFTISSGGSPAGALVVVYQLASSAVPPYQEPMPRFSGLRVG